MSYKYFQIFNKRYRNIIALVIIIAILCFIARFVGWVLFAENVETKRGTISYYLRLPSKLIRTFPIIQPVGEPVYLSDAADGPAPSTEGLKYESSGKRDFLLKSIYDHITQFGYVKTDEENTLGEGQVFKKGNMICEVAITPTDHETSLVEARELYYH